MNELKVSISREGVVIGTFELGTVTEVEVDTNTVRYFHSGSPQETQGKIAGFGFRTRKEAAEALSQLSLSAGYTEAELQEALR